MGINGWLKGRKGESCAAETTCARLTISESVQEGTFCVYFTKSIVFFQASRDTLKFPQECDEAQVFTFLVPCSLVAVLPVEINQSMIITQFHSTGSFK